MDEFKKEGDVNDSAWMRQQLATIMGNGDVLRLIRETVISDNEIMIDYDLGEKNQRAEMIRAFSI
jgi:hypothetical protein